MQIKRLLQPGQPSLDGREPGICLFDLLMGIEVLQAPLLDLLLDVLLQLCHQQPKARPAAPRTRRQPMFSSLANAYSRSALSPFVFSPLSELLSFRLEVLLSSHGLGSS